MKNKELLPCPFCGGEAVLRIIDNETNYVACTECHALSFVGNEEETISAWNRRTNKIPVGNGKDYTVVNDGR